MSESTRAIIKIRLDQLKQVKTIRELNKSEKVEYMNLLLAYFNY